MSEDKKIEENVTSGDDDKELSDLLDSALEDFSKVPKKSTSKPDDTKKDDVKKPEDGEEALASEWSEEFIRQAVDQFESNLSNILKDSGLPELSTDELQNSLQQMAEAASQVRANPPTESAGDADFANSISQALRGLSEGTESLNSAFNEQNLMSMFGQSGEGQANNFLPFMQGMMQSLLSKEVLYPSLKDISSKYPAWLQSHRESLSPEEHKNYEQQYLLMVEICKHLETEKADDTPEQKKKQFETVLDLMQKMQDLGQPPAELVGDMSGTFPFDTQGAQDQCSLM